MVHYDVTEEIDEGGGLDPGAIHEMSPSEARAVAHKTASLLHHVTMHHTDETDHEKLGHIAHAHLATLGGVKSKEELGGNWFSDIGRGISNFGKGLWNGIKTVGEHVWKGVKTVAKPLLSIASTVGPVIATALGQPELAPVISMATQAASQLIDGGGFADPDELSHHIVSYMKDGRKGSFDGLVQHIVKHSSKNI